MGYRLEYIPSEDITGSFHPRPIPDEFIKQISPELSSPYYPTSDEANAAGIRYKNLSGIPPYKHIIITDYESYKFTVLSQYESPYITSHDYWAEDIQVYRVDKETPDPDLARAYDLEYEAFKLRMKARARLFCPPTSTRFPYKLEGHYEGCEDDRTLIGNFATKQDAINRIYEIGDNNTLKDGETPNSNADSEYPDSWDYTLTDTTTSPPTELVLSIDDNPTRWVTLAEYLASCRLPEPDK